MTGRHRLSWLLTRYLACPVIGHRWGRNAAHGRTCTRCGTFRAHQATTWLEPS